jgi:hypothetical protein
MIQTTPACALRKPSMRSTAALLVCAAALSSCVTYQLDGPGAKSAPTNDLSGLRSVQQSGAPARPDRGGPWEVALGGAGGSNDNLSSGSGQAAAQAGYYLNDCVELVVRQNGAYSDPGNANGENWASASRAALDFHIPFGNFVPYAGVNFGYAYGDAVRDTMICGPEAGLKLYVKQDVFVLLAGEYRFALTKDDSLGTAFDDGQLIYGISLGFRF